MPTPSYHGGAKIFPIPLVAPGFAGLNKQEGASLLGPEWATTLINAVVDSEGKLAARKGFSSLTGSAEAANFVQTFEYYDSDGTTRQISTTDSDIFEGIDTFTSREGALTITDGNWQLVNFQDKVIGFQNGETPIVKTGDGNFASIVAAGGGTVPTGGIGLSAFGRIWVTNSANTSIRYCDILDETTWDDSSLSGDAGVIDMYMIWPNGQDTITAIAAHNGRLVVFGKKQMVVFGDAEGYSGSPPDRGLNPETMLMVDSYSYTGCVARDSVQNVNDDLWWLSDYGVMSMGRLMQERSPKMSVVSRQIQDYLTSTIRATTTDSVLDNIRSAYNERERLYWLSFPDEGKSFTFDTRGVTQRGIARAFEWTLAPNALCNTRAQELVMALDSITGELGEYSGYQDDGASYNLEYRSGWLDFGANPAFSSGINAYLKILKRFKAIVNVATVSTITFKWWWDFIETPYSYQITLESDAAAEWGVAEWGEDEWSGGLSLRNLNAHGQGTGQYLRVGVLIPINGSDFGLQQLDIYSKIGRLA